MRAVLLQIVLLKANALVVASSEIQHPARREAERCALVVAFKKIGDHLKIEYEYDEKSRDDEDRLQVEGEALNAEKLDLLPLDLLDKLRNATLGGDKKGLDHLILKIGENVDVEIAQVLQGLGSLADPA